MGVAYQEAKREARNEMIAEGSREYIDDSLEELVMERIEQIKKILSRNGYKVVERKEE